MLLVASVHQDERIHLSPEQRRLMADDPDLCRRVNVRRSTVPAVTHVDYSARIQTVDEVRNPRFYRLLKAFQERTGCPMLANTSFNVRGEPIVCTPLDALHCFQATDMDALVLGDFLVRKQERHKSKSAERQARHLARFSPD